MSKTWTLEVKQMIDDGDHFIEFPEEMLKEAGWQPGDTLKWTDRGDGSWTLSKIEEGGEMKTYQCEVCDHIHDEAVDGKLEDLPKFANCPKCGSDAREVYKEVEF